MAENENQIGQELLNLPLGEVVRSLAMAVADAQFELDKSSIIMAEFMSGQRLLRDVNTGELILKDGKAQKIDSRVYFGYTIDENDVRREQKLSMLELGFVPNFYQFVDTVIEIKLAIRANKVSGGGGTVLTSTPVDAAYASAYNYSADLACVFKTKLVPIPPPAALNERLQLMLGQDEEEDTQ